jgi:hypothetical protein
MTAEAERGLLIAEKNGSSLIRWFLRGTKIEYKEYKLTESSLVY